MTDTRTMTRSEMRSHAWARLTIDGIGGGERQVSKVLAFRNW
jgi:hypothetical protein